MQDYRKLRVWQRAHQLAKDVYLLSRRLPADERYGLVSQVRRAAISIPCNIVEGSKRRFKRDFAHFLNVAESSAAELGYAFELITDFGYLEASVTQPIRAEATAVESMLYGLRQSVMRQHRCPEE